jgi:uncharacterized protein YbjT (DUF2867 family)
MHVLLTGATGLIGSSILARLKGRGDRVRAVSRGAVRDGDSDVDWVRLDMAAARSAEVWFPLLEGIDAVVNCAGVLQDSRLHDTSAIHEAAPAALFDACDRAGVRRVIHFSAIGVDRATPSNFSRTKLAGDRALMALDLDWVILRPSVVLGRTVFGASALIRGLAALPVLPVMPATAPLQPVLLEDVTDTVLALLPSEAPVHVALELVGPERLDFAAIVRRYRRWLGHTPAREVPVPEWLAVILYRLGDLAGAMGWRSAMRTTARLEIARGATGDPGPWTRLTGIEPRSLDEALAAEPATVQERRFANLFFLKPVIFVSLALFWALSGVSSLWPGYSIGIALMEQGGAATIAPLAVIGGGIADLAIGIGIAFRRTARPALWAGIAVSLAYALAGTLVLPRLWIDPLAPLLKIVPTIALMLVALAVLKGR